MENENSDIKVKKNNNSNIKVYTKKTLIFVLIGFLALFILHVFMPRIGFLSPLDKGWIKSPQGVRIDTDDEDYPLVFKNDQFRFVSVENSPSGRIVNWQWIYQVRNKGEKKLNVNVNYMLEDDAKFELASSISNKMIEPGETVKIRGMGEINVASFRRVENRIWSIGYSE
jgi:hypothetical protein